MRHVFTPFSLLAFLVFFSSQLFSQEKKLAPPIGSRFCAQEQAMQQAFQQQPLRRIAHEQMEEAIYTSR